MKILTVCLAILLFLPAWVLIACQLAMAGHGEGTVLDRIHTADQPFDNMQIESAHQLPVKTVLAKEFYQGERSEFLPVRMP